MQQKLILPVNRTRVTASAFNRAYRERFGYPHYGTDLVSAVGDRTVYASGTGTLIIAGWDEYAGNTVVIRYPGAYLRSEDRYEDIIFRYFHLDSLARIPTGEGAITKDTVLGRYGGSGFGSMTRWSPHLHLEADTDVRYPRHSPTFGASGSVIFGRGAGATADSVRDALSYLYLKPTPPDSQTYQTDGKPYVDDRDLCVPELL